MGHRFTEPRFAIVPVRFTEAELAVIRKARGETEAARFIHDVAMDAARGRPHVQV